MLVRQPKINFKITVRADCAVSARSPLPLSIKKSSCSPKVSGKESAFWQESASLPLTASLCDKANIHFHQPCLSTDFRAGSSRTPLPVAGFGAHVAPLCSRDIVISRIPRQDCGHVSALGWLERAPAASLLLACWPQEGDLGGRS